MIDFRRFAGQLLAHVRARYTAVTQHKLAADLHYSRDHIASVESGRRGLSVELGRKIDTYFELPGVFETTARELERHPYPYADLTGLEQVAVEIRLWDQRAIPALMQTPDYAHASLRDTTLVDKRLKRQADTTGTLACVLDEAVLWRRIGDTEAFAAQLAALKGRVYVLPLSSGMAAGLDGAVTLIDTPDQTVAWLESQGPGVLVDNPVEVQRLVRMWDSVLGAALPLDVSADMIEAIALELKRWE